jgi:hypothetical protein
VSSSGEPLPFTFARGTFIVGANPNNPAAYSPRRDGMTVRGTAIADARPALRVGTAAAGLPGVTSSSLSNACWMLLPPGAANDPSTLCGGVSPLFASPGQTAGAAVTPGLGPIGAAGAMAYLPIFDQNTLRVIGFGFVQVNGSQVTPIYSHVATANATALVTGGLQVQGLPLLTAAEGALLVPVLGR